MPARPSRWICRSRARPWHRDPSGKASCQAAGWAAHMGSRSASHMPKSGSSATSQPPGASQEAIRCSAAIRPGCASARRGCAPGQGAFGELIRAHVVAQHRQIRQRQPGQETGLQVGGGDLPLGGEVLGQPGGDGAAATAELQAPGSRPRPSARSSAWSPGPDVRRTGPGGGFRRHWCAGTHNPLGPESPLRPPYPVVTSRAGGQTRLDRAHAGRLSRGGLPRNPGGSRQAGG